MTGDLDFTLDPDALARDLIGAWLGAGDVGGIIVETEAYDAADPASHSFNGPTARNAAMFGPPGHAYVYRSYGLHWCFNIVCGPTLGGAVLIRALEPRMGLPIMRERRGAVDDRRLCAGPGRLTQALNISASDNGRPLDSPALLVRREEDRPVIVGRRIGITKAADRMARYGAEGSRFLSAPFPHGR